MNPADLRMGDQNQAVNICCNWSAQNLPCEHMLDRMDEGRVPELDPNCGYEYDVFAVCGDSVKSWTEEHLLQSVIADKWGFKIYRNDFDCPLGVPVAEQWCDAITRSRKVILCLTDDFAFDEWNEFITQRAHAESPAFRQRKILPIKLTPGGFLPPYLDGILNYLDWPRLQRNERDQKYFWRNIRRSLLDGRNTVRRPRSPNGSPPPQPPPQPPPGPPPPPPQRQPVVCETSMQFVSNSPGAEVQARPEANYPAEHGESSWNQPAENEEPSESEEEKAEFEEYEGTEGAVKNEGYTNDDEPSTFSSQTEVKRLESFDDGSTEPKISLPENPFCVDNERVEVRDLALIPPTVSETGLESDPVVSLRSTQTLSYLETWSDEQQTEHESQFQESPVDIAAVAPNPGLGASDSGTPVVSLHTDPDQTRRPDSEGVTPEAQGRQGRFVPPLEESSPNELSQVSQGSVETISRNSPVNQGQNEVDEGLGYSAPSRTLIGVSYEYVNESRTVTQSDEEPQYDGNRNISQRESLEEPPLYDNQNVQFVAVFILGVILTSLYNWLWSLASDPG